MKRFAKITALAVGLAAMLFAGCSDVSDDAIVTKNAQSADNFRTLIIDVTSNSNLINFDEPVVDSSRTILPEAQTCDALWFYLCSKNNTAGATTWAKPVAVTVTKKPTDTTGRTGEVIINLTKADYDFELIAIPRGSETTAPDQNDEGTAKNAAVLIGVANADIRNDDTVSFYMTAEGLTTQGTADLILYSDGWDLETDFPAFHVTTTGSESPTARLAYTKKTVTSSTTKYEGDLVDGTKKNDFKLLTAAPTTTPPTTTPDFSVATAYHSSPVLPGTYTFEISFSNGTKTYTWSDRIIILPGQATQKVIGIPPIIEKVPLAPNYLNVAYIDPESTTTEYYNAEFVWDSKGNDGTNDVEINNEEKFELELMEIPAAVDKTKITEYVTALADSNATDTTKAQAWETIKTTATAAGGKDIVWSTKDGTTNTAAPGSTAVNVDTKVFYGNLETYVAGSLQKNNQYAIFKLPLGSRYIARIRAVNDAGASSWVYADLSQDIKGAKANPNTNVKIANELDVSTITGMEGCITALHFTSDTINRYRVTYALSGGTLTTAADGIADPTTAVTSGTALPSTTPTTLPTVYYYCQKFYTPADPTAGTSASGGIEIMQPLKEVWDATAGGGTGAYDSVKFTTLEADGANPVLVATEPLLKLGQQTWTNWLCDRNNLGNSNTTGIYNEVGDKPENYGGCQSLMLVANFATVGSVTIFDDDNYAILDVKSKSYKTYNNGTLSDAVASGAAAITSDAEKDASNNITTKAVIYKIEASQKNDVNLEWTVSYPDGVTYDNVTLVLTKTDGQRSYTVGNIKAASDGKSGTFVLKVSEYVKGVYNAKISAWSAVKPNDPYTANIVLTIVD